MVVSVIYASQKGSTAEIAERISYRLEELDHQVDLINTTQTKTLDQPYDSIILLTPIYKGMWLPDMSHFVRRNQEVIADTPVYGIFPCVRVLEESGKQYAYTHYLPDRIVNMLNLVDVRFIAGKLVRDELTLDDLQTLSTRYDGKQLNQIQGDYRDWFDIHNWTNNISKLIKAASQKQASHSTG